MANRDAFIIVVNTLKALSQTITDEQRKRLLQQAVQQHSLSIDEADHILKASGLVVGESINYFEVLGFSIEEFQNQSEDTIAINVDIAHKKYYAESLRAGGLPRPDGRTQEQWRTVLNQARDTLKDPQKRTEHIASIQTDLSQVGFPTLESEKFASSEGTSLTLSVPEDMVLIPAGEFKIGSNNTGVKDRKNPGHTVYIDAFYMDKYPVTNAQFKVFLNTNPRWQKPSKWNDWNKAKKMMLSIFGKYHDGDYLKHWNGNYFPLGKDDHPVTHVSWYAAMAYAQWVGKRLPTDMEWDKAARGGLTTQKYPWGNSLDPSMVYCGKEVGETTSVGKYPENNYGLHDMIGNIWEWCLDEYAPNFYASSQVRNPVAGVSTKEELDLLIINFRNVATDRVLRGGTLFTSSEPVQTAARRSGSPFLTTLYIHSIKYLTSHSKRFAANIGFRCAWKVRLKSESL